MNFNNLEWHDSIIRNVMIDRSNPGNQDVLQIEIDWPNGTRSILFFKNVYWANLEMNFGVVCPESILKAHSEGRESVLVKNFYQKWKGMINDIDLNFYEIETNTTRSKIKIIAQKFELE
ncbi:hypothetical protein DSECCO2_553780 [anaerobic digester metagenome]